MKLFKCSNCGSVRIYDAANHARYTSLAVDETCLDRAAYACSSKCAHVIGNRFDCGEWELPEIGIKEYVTYMRRRQRGYKKQPSQMELKKRFNQSNVQGDSQSPDQ